VPYFNNKDISNCMNGVLFELFGHSWSRYIEAPNVNLASLCKDISSSLKQKILSNTVANTYKSEIITALDAVSGADSIKNFCFDLDDYSETVISDLDMCVQTRCILNYLLFINFMI